MTTRESSIRVSVIMPFLNAERFIDEAIQSVLAQTYAGWELILVDDGSTDGSTSIARRYVEQHPKKILYFEHEGHQNRGASASRNLGLHHARREYVALLDSDDVWPPDKLKEQVDLLDATPEAGAVFGATLWWYGWTETIADKRRDFIALPGFTSGTLLKPPQVLTGYLNEEVPVPLPSTMLLRRSSVDSVGGFEDEFRKVYTDQAFFTKLFLVTPAVACDTCWALYRRHPGSSCVIARRAGELDQAELTYLEWALDYLAKEGMQKTEVWEALRRRLWRRRHPGLARLSNRLYSLAERVYRPLRKVKQA